MKKFEPSEQSKMLCSLYAHALDMQKTFINQLLHSSIIEVIELWILDHKDTYEKYILEMVWKKIIIVMNQDDNPLRAYEFPNHYKSMAEKIYKDPNSKKYQEILISFTEYLETITQGKIKKIIFTDFSDPLHIESVINNLKLLRDRIVIKLMMATGRNLNKILKLNISDILFEKKKIQIGPDLIRIPKSLIMWIGIYIHHSKSNRIDDRLFITIIGKPVFRTHFLRIIKYESEQAGLPKPLSLTDIQWNGVSKYLTSSQSIEKTLKKYNLKKLPKRFSSFHDK